MRISFLFVLCAITNLVFAQQKPPLIIENGQYFDGEKFVAFRAMEVIEGKINKISIDEPLASDESYHYIDAQGKYIIPGLIDCHVHLQGSPGAGNSYVGHSFNSHSALRAGVTTQMDLFSSKYAEMGRMADNFPQYFGTVLNAGPCLTVPGGHGANMGSPAQLTSVADAEEWAKKLCADDAVDYIKIIYQRHSNKKAMTFHQMQAIVKIAHQKGKKVLAHIDHTLDALECAHEGVDALAHIPMKKMSPTEVDSLKRSGIVVVPTITVYQASYDGMDAAYGKDSLLLASAHPSHLEGLYGGSIKPDSKKEYWPFEIDYMYNLKLLIAAGVPIMAGTDAGNYATFYGYALHHELEEYVNGGMTTAQALNTATTNVSSFLPEKKIGKLAEGYQADMVFLNANPLENISNTKSIYKVLNRGVELQILPFKKD